MALKGRGGLCRIAFLYWGRRGALTEFTHALARTALAMPDLEPTISVSRQNEAFARFMEFAPALVPIDTFSSDRGAVGAAWHVPALRRQMRKLVLDRQLDAAVTLMPHLWSPLVNGAIRGAGARYATIIHDASRHPGDHRGFADWWTRRDALGANVVFTLSETVRDRLVQNSAHGSAPIVPLFHPELDFGRGTIARVRDASRPMRLLFLGRIMRYKGLGLLVESLELLKTRGVPFELGVYGEGSIEPYAARLGALGATVVNRWLSEAEVADAFAAHDAVVLSHVEASQSGVAAAAFGAGLPVVATPIGGLREQVRDDETGIMATAAEPSAFANAVARLVNDPALYDSIAKNLRAGAESRSMRRFIERIVAALGETPPPSV